MYPERPRWCFPLTRSGVPRGEISECGSNTDGEILLGVSIPLRYAIGSGSLPRPIQARRSFRAFYLFVQPTLAARPYRVDTFDVRLDVQKRRTVDDIDASDRENILLDADQFNNGQADLVRTFRRSGGEDPSICVVLRGCDRKGVVAGEMEMVKEYDMGEAGEILQAGYEFVKNRDESHRVFGQGCLDGDLDRTLKRRVDNPYRGILDVLLHVMLFHSYLHAVKQRIYKKPYTKQRKKQGPFSGMRRRWSLSEGKKMMQLCVTVGMVETSHVIRPSIHLGRLEEDVDLERGIADIRRRSAHAISSRTRR